MAAPIPNFPTDKPNQTYVSVKAVVGGHVWLRDSLTFLDAADTDDSQGAWVPAFSFLITHPTKGKVLFDLGVRKHGHGYPPALVDRVKWFKPDCEKDVADLLLEGGVEPSEINTIIYSHLHWDHIGDPERFPSAEIVVGAETEVILADAYPKNPESRFAAFPEGRKVTYVDFNRPSKALLSPFASFERAIDLYGDGSLYLVDAPGHVQGHMLAAVRVGPDTFLLLSGDTCHHRDCYAGSRLMSKTMYLDWDLALETVRRLSRVHHELPNVLVVLAHEPQREKEMPLFPLEVNEWAVKEVEKRKNGKV